jgi:hypothetical protein
MIDPRDIEPTQPKPPADDADRPRWVSENVTYLERLGEYRNLQQFKAQHPELKGRMWHDKEPAPVASVSSPGLKPFGEKAEEHSVPSHYSYTVTSKGTSRPFGQ